MKKFILILTLIIALLLCACGKDEPETIKLEGYFNGTKLEITGLAEGDRFANIKEMLYKDGKIYLLGSLMSTERMESAIMSFDTKTEKWEQLALPYDGSFRTIVMSEDGYLFVASEFDSTTFRETYSIIATDRNRILWEKPLGDFMELPERFWGSIYAESTDGNWTLAVGDSLVVIDADGTVLTNDTLSGEARGMFTADDGLHIFGYDFHSILPSDGEMRDDASWLKALGSNDSIALGEGYDLIKSNEVGLFGVNIAEGTSELLMNWVNSGIAASPDKIAMASQDVIYIYRSDSAASMSGEDGFWKYERCPADEIPEREIIRITYVEDGRGKMPLAAVQFNKSQAKYHVICEEYIAGGGDYATMNEGINSMLLDGSIGDIVEFESISDLEKYGTKGYLADLNPLMSGMIEADDVFGCVRTACETNSKLYGMPQEFVLETCATKKGALDAYSTWNTDAFIDMYQKLTADGKYIIRDTSRNAIDSYLGDGMMQSFLDFDAGTCSFDSEEFRDLITFLATLPEENTCEIDAWRENHYITDEILLYETRIGSYSDWGHLLSIYQGKDYDMVGYPSEDGGVAKLDAMTYYAISEGSKVKEGAMEFLAYFLSSECLIDEMRGMRYIPSLKTTMEAWNESEGQMYYYYEYGDLNGWSGNNEPFDESKREPGIQIFAGDPEIVNGLYAFLDTVKIAKPIPEACEAIITEELTAFYGGAKTADETAKLLQNRVGTYLAENKQ